jgi:parvulin-like peptidyl-prolyl isomerase
MMKRKMAGLLAILFAMTTALTGCSAGNKLDNSAEAMNVDGVSVPLGEVSFLLRYQQTQMQAMYGSLFGDDFMNQDLMGLGTPYGETIRDSVVETLQEYYVVEAHAEELGVELDDDEKAAAADAAAAFLAANDSKTLKAMSADEETVTHVLELMTLQQKVYDDRAATIDTEVDEEEAAQKRISYVLSSTEGTTDDDGNTVELTDEELAEKRETLEAILAEAKESGDLSTAAEAYDMSAVSATYGKDDSTLNEDVLAAAETLSDGEFSDLVESDNGYYIIYMESTYDEDATQQKIESILSDREEEAYNNWLTPFTDEAEITTNDDVIATLTFERVYTTKTEE